MMDPGIASIASNAVVTTRRLGSRPTAIRASTNSLLELVGLSDGSTPRSNDRFAPASSVPTRVRQSAENSMTPAARAEPVVLSRRFAHDVRSSHSIGSMTVNMPLKPRAVEWQSCGKWAIATAEPALSAALAHARN
jgi:hypothetical protein